MLAGLADSSAPRGSIVRRELRNKTRRCRAATALLVVLLAGCTLSSTEPGAPVTSAGAPLAATPVRERPAVSVPVVFWFEDYDELLVVPGLGSLPVGLLPR